MFASDNFSSSHDVRPILHPITFRKQQILRDPPTEPPMLPLICINNTRPIFQTVFTVLPPSASTYYPVHIQSHHQVIQI